MAYETCKDEEATYASVNEGMGLHKCVNIDGQGLGNPNGIRDLQGRGGNIC